MRLKLGKETVLVISDTQAPFAHPDALDFLEALKDKYKPTKIVAIGDTLDMHTLSQFVHDPDGHSASTEYTLAIEWMKQLYELFPEAQETASNHNSRYLKRAKAAGIPTALLKSYDQVMHYPDGWSCSEWLEIDGVIYEHGTRFNGMHAARSAPTVNGQSTVFGHLHSAGGISYVANQKQLLFGMCVGCLIDYRQYAFSYAQDSKWKPTLGTGIVVKGVPSFVPMIVDKRERWIKEIIV